jgi:hypothetical protein
MQTISDELATLLISHLQAAAAGFRGRIEVDAVVDIAAACSVDSMEFLTDSPITIDYTPITSAIDVPTENPSMLLAVLKLNGPHDYLGHDLVVASPWTMLDGDLQTGVGAGPYIQKLNGIAYLPYAGGTIPDVSFGWIGGTPPRVGEGFIMGVAIHTSATTPVQTANNLPADTIHLGSAPTSGNILVMTVHGVGVSTAAGYWTLVHKKTWTANDGYTPLEIDVMMHCVGVGESQDITPPWDSSSHPFVSISEWVVEATTGAVRTASRQPKRIDIDQSLNMGAGQMTAEFANEGLPLGWASTSVFPTNSRIRAYQWYGDDDANAVRTFTGIIDRVGDSRDPLTTVIACRDMMAILIDQTHTATGPQGADETGAVRTEANGVYLNHEVDYIVSDILDRWGWPTADRAITATSYVLAEFIIADGESGTDAIIGADKLTGLVGYDAWADELGVFHFAPNASASALTEAAVPAYTFRTGVDIMSLSDEMTQYDLRTRVKVRGPLTTETLTDTWREEWRTDKFAKPVGIWYDPADSGNIRVLDRGTKRLYKLRQSDQVVLSSTYLGTVIPYPLDVSGDPADASVYWVLNCPWKYTGATTGNSVKKVTKATNAVAASYSLPDGRWTALKVSSANLWLTNWDTDRLHKRSKADGTAVADYGHTVGGVTQTNPSGLMVDGTTLHVFWSNSGTTARFLICSESAPGTITKVITTAGTVLVGGEMDTTTHTACWGCSDGIGLVAKFTLVDVSSTTAEVFAEVVDSDLEDELGTLAQTEPRIHDTHPGDPAHPWMIRRDTVTLDAIISLAQATDTAGRRLDKLAHRSRVLDFGILGNPAVQKTDLVRVEDPVTGIGENFLIDTHRSGMAAESTYAGTIAGIPVVSPGDVVTDDGDAT